MHARPDGLGSGVLQGYDLGMPHQKLTDTLSSLHQQLSSGEPLDEGDREHLEAMLVDIQVLLDAEEVEEPSLGEKVSEAVGRFEISHPELAATLSELAAILRPL